MNTYASIALTTTFDGEKTLHEGVIDVAIRATTLGAARSLRLMLNDPDGSISELVAEDMPVEFAWAFNRGAAERIFRGTIKTIDRTKQKIVSLAGFDDWRRIAGEKHTITYANQSPSDMLRALVADELGIDASRIADSDMTLDKLPLYRQSVADAVKIINRRLGLDHQAFIDGDGVFAWLPVEFDADAELDFKEGINVFWMDLRRRMFCTWAQPLVLAQVIRIIDENDVSKKAFVTGIEYANADGGSRITVSYVPEPEGEA